MSTQLFKRQPHLFNWFAETSDTDCVRMHVCMSQIIHCNRSDTLKGGYNVKNKKSNAFSSFATNSTIKRIFRKFSVKYIGKLLMKAQKCILGTVYPIFQSQNTWQEDIN